MIKSTLGAPLGGTIVEGQYGLESTAVSLITPPNFGSGGGICLPSMVVVAPGEPGVPVLWTCAMTGGEAAIKAAAKIPLRRISVFTFMGLICVVLEEIRMDVIGDFAGFIEFQLWASCVERDIGPWSHSPRCRNRPERNKLGDS